MALCKLIHILDNRSLLCHGCLIDGLDMDQDLHASASAIHRDPLPNLRGGVGPFREDWVTVFAFSVCLVNMSFG